MIISPQTILNSRRKLKLTQKQLGKLIGVSKNTIYNYERGESIPKNKVPLLKKVFSEIPEESGRIMKLETREKEAPEVGSVEDIISDLAVKKLIPLIRERIEELVDLKVKEQTADINDSLYKIYMRNVELDKIIQELKERSQKQKNG